MKAPATILRVVSIGYLPLKTYRVRSVACYLSGKTYEKMGVKGHGGLPSERIYRYTRFSRFINVQEDWFRWERESRQGCDRVLWQSVNRSWNPIEIVPFHNSASMLKDYWKSWGFMHMRASARERNNKRDYIDYVFLRTSPLCNRPDNDLAVPKRHGKGFFRFGSRVSVNKNRSPSYWPSCPASSHILCKWKGF